MRAGLRACHNWVRALRVWHPSPLARYLTLPQSPAHPRARLLYKSMHGPVWRSLASWPLLAYAGAASAGSCHTCSGAAHPPSVCAASWQERNQVPAGARITLCVGCWHLDRMPLPLPPAHSPKHTSSLRASYSPLPCRMLTHDVGACIVLSPPCQGVPECRVCYLAWPRAFNQKKRVLVFVAHCCACMGLQTTQLG